MTNDISSPTTPDAPQPAADQADLAAVGAQLGRPPRGVRRVAHRCPCGNPDVVDRAAAAGRHAVPDAVLPDLPEGGLSDRTLEATGVMREMTERLRPTRSWPRPTAPPHEDYLARRDAIEVLEGSRPPAACRTG